MPKDEDAQILQILGREARKEPFRNGVLAECRLILAEAQAPQPDHDVLDSALFRVAAHHRSVWGGVQERLRSADSVSIRAAVKNSATLGGNASGVNQCQQDR